MQSSRKLLGTPLSGGARTAFDVPSNFDVVVKKVDVGFVEAKSGFFGTRCEGVSGINVRFAPLRTQVGTSPTSQPDECQFVVGVRARRQVHVTPSILGHLLTMEVMQSKRLCNAPKVAF